MPGIGSSDQFPEINWESGDTPYTGDVQDIGDTGRRGIPREEQNELAMKQFFEDQPASIPDWKPQPLTAKDKTELHLARDKLLIAQEEQATSTAKEVRDDLKLMMPKSEKAIVTRKNLLATRAKNWINEKRQTYLTWEGQAELAVKRYISMRQTGGAGVWSACDYSLA
jgi:hypothetical protein